MTRIVDRTRLTDLHASEKERFITSHKSSAAMSQRASEHLVAGVPNSWMTRWGGPFPIFAAEAHGARLVDVDGIEYVDLAMGDTGAFSGHSLPQIASAIANQASRAITTVLPSEDSIYVGAEMTRRFGLPLWQLTLSASDANRFVLRLVRAATGRPKILVFDGCYHGTVDETLASLRADGKVVARSSNLAPPVDPSLTTKVVHWNDLEGLSSALLPGDVACVLTEPLLTNIGIVYPDPGFHEAMRTLCDETGTLLVIDETHTTASGPGGCTARWGLRPDVITVGKPIGGGVPVGAYGMTEAVGEKITEAIRDSGVDVSGIGGTLTGNALSVAAMRAALECSLREEDFAVSDPLAAEFKVQLAEVIDRWELPWSVEIVGSRGEYMFCPLPHNGEEGRRGVDDQLHDYFNLFALNRGVLLSPFSNLVHFSSSHVAADVDLHTEVFEDTVKSLFS
jgi:glutamate-1-semialdehyde 2,1-aminomutase